MATQNNVVIATFGTGRDARTRSLFQYDYGITLKIEGIELPQTYEVHFTNFEHMGQATVVIGGSSGEITIPQASLANGNDIEAYIYLHASGSDGETVYHVKIPIIPRAKPNYDTPTPEEQTVMQTLIAQTAEATQAANKAASDANDLLDDIPAAVAEVKAAVEAKGDEVLDSIPADYTSLTNKVNRIDDSINNSNTGIWKAISDIHIVNRNQDDRIAELEAVAIYTTPESFGAVGDGVADDTTAVQNAFNSDLPVLLTKKYAVSSGLTIDKDKYVVCDADAEILPIANIETMLTVGGGTTEPTNPVMPGLIKVIWSGGTFNCENGNYKAEVGIDLQKLYHSKFSDISIINVNYGIGMSWSGTYGALAIAENVSVRGSASRMAKYGFKIARNDQRLYNCSAIDCLDGYLIQNAYTRLFGCHVWVTRSLNWANTFGYRVNANHCGFIECTVDTVHTGFIFTSSVQTCVITNLFWLNNTDVVPNYSGMTLFQGINTTDYISVQCSVNNLQCQSFTQDVTLKKYLADNNMFPIISLEANDVSHITDYDIAIQPEIIKNEIDDLKSDLKQTKDEIIETAGVIEELECGLTEEVKAALLACFTRVAWIGDDGQDYYDALESALNNTRILNSIRALFAQGSAVIYDTDELYSLKQYLTVTATYDDGTEKEVNNYTLNGKLVAGTSMITVAYNKKTTTFDVTVTHQGKTLESISATFNSSAVITTDNVLDDLRPYLTVRATYSDGSTNTVTNYTLSGSLNVGTNTITVTYNNKTATFTVNVTEAQVVLQSISASFNQGSTAIYTDNTLDDLKPYLTVTARYSDSTTQTVTEYTLSGTLTAGTSTITASYGGKTAMFNVTVSERPVTLQSITATFTQGSAVIYTDSSLNDLKPYLVVTANYSDGTSQTVTNYTLNGTLTEGTSTITTSYGGKTATFNVTVTERVTPSVPIYTLTTPAIFDGTSYIDTEMQLVNSNEKNITIVGDLLDKSMPTSGNTKMLFHCMHEVSPYPGITIQTNPATTTTKHFVLNVNSDSASGGYGIIKALNIIEDESEGIREKFVAIIDNQNSTFTLIGVFGGTYFYETKALPSGYSSTEITETAVIGARKRINDGTTQYDHYWKGTIYDLKIYDRAWDKTEADNYVNGGNS